MEDVVVVAVLLVVLAAVEVIGLAAPAVLPEEVVSVEEAAAANATRSRYSRRPSFFCFFSMAGILGGG